MKNTLMFAVCMALTIPVASVTAALRAGTHRSDQVASGRATAKSRMTTMAPQQLRHHRAKKSRLPQLRVLPPKPTVPPKVVARPTPRPTVTPVPRVTPPAIRIPTVRPTAVPTPVPTATPAPTPRPAATPVPTATVPPGHEPPPLSVNLPGFTTVDDQTWDETAVRKVLHTFAYGGQTSDEQIQVWADMAPASAIVEMLTFAEHNPKLSTPTLEDTDNLSNTHNSLESLASLWSSNTDGNRMPVERRSNFGPASWDRNRDTWMHSVMSRGLNPFRERVGFWETNYHMAVTIGGGRINPAQLTRYYDSIMDAHARGLPYEDVIGIAAASAAVARQYRHDENRWIDYAQRCECNEDFAREFHQLFFGVLGVQEPYYHETTTIKNTALLLTDFRLKNDLNPEAFWDGDRVEFGTEFHYSQPVEIAHRAYTTRTALDGIQSLIQNEIEEPESLDNLPVMIVRHFGDDKLTLQETNGLRSAWRSMPRKDLLTFLQAYATSTMFHSTERFKYKTSFDRHLILNNLVTQSNEDVYLDLPDIWRLSWEEQQSAFVPDHAVFGGQTGEDAVNNANLFRLNYNAMGTGYRFVRPEGTVYGRDFQRDWSQRVPRDHSGQFTVAATAEWLWQRLIADGLKNFGPLERAYTFALLATGQDFAALIHPGSPYTPPTLDEVDGATGRALMASLGSSVLALDSQTKTDRDRANERVGQAIGFIAATPYNFAQEGR